MPGHGHEESEECTGSAHLAADLCIKHIELARITAECNGTKHNMSEGIAKSAKWQRADCE